MSTPLGQLTSICGRLGSEPDRKKKAEMLASFLNELGPDEIEPAILILLAQVLPKSERGGLDVGYGMVKKAIYERQFERKHRDLPGPEPGTVI